jgi:hypothetical protein
MGFLLKMATSIADFIKKHNLNGVDIDWEYPGAPDIPGIPAGGKDDGKNYLAFLATLKNLLPGKSVSIAAPASYWYLKQFPIKEISKVVNYIVFMTYDLHGQLDRDQAILSHDHQGRRTREESHRGSYELWAILQDGASGMLRSELSIHRRLFDFIRRERSLHRHRWVLSLLGRLVLFC